MSQKPNMEQLLKNLGEEYLREQFQQEEDHEFSQEYQKKKENLLAAAGGKTRRRWSKTAAACACAVLVLSVSLSVYAAISIYHASVDVDKDKGEANIHLERTDNTYVPPIKIYADYLPQGYKEWDENKYSLNGEYGGTGITIASANWQSDMTVAGASEAEDTTINGVKATVLTRKGSEYSHIIYLFYEETGNVIEIMASDEIPLEEVIKVAENVRYEVVQDEDKTYQAFQNPVQEDQEVLEEQIKFGQDDIIRVGDTLPYVNLKETSDGSIAADESLKYTVKNAEVLDKVPADSMDSRFFSDPQAAEEYISEDGTLLPYQRTEVVWEDNETKTKDLGTVNMKYLQVTMEVTNTAEEPIEDIGLNPRLYQYGREDSDTYRILSQDMYGIQPDQMPFYFDQSSYLQERKHFYYMNFAPSETKTIHLGFAIAEDRLQDSCLVFQENSEFTKYLFW